MKRARLVLFATVVGLGSAVMVATRSQDAAPASDEAAIATPGPALPEDAPDPAGFAARRVEIQGLMDGYTDDGEERRILDLLAEAPPAELDRLLRRLDVSALIGSLDDHTFGGQHRTELYELLSSRRIADLSVVARAALIDALQRGSTDPAAERTVEAVLLATRGVHLTRLKNLIDGGKDPYDFLQLFAHDLDEPQVKARIAAHLEGEGRRLPAAGIKVLHDIDDTLFCSLKDDRYPKGTVYPGILALERELCLGVPSTAATTTATGGQLVFLTARPDDRAHLVEGQTFATLASLGVGPATILAGGLIDFRSNDAMAAGKRANFDAYSPLFPEYRYVFLGDSGQGDVIFGRGVRKDHPELVHVVLIHDVVATPADVRAEHAREGVIFVDTWLGGAVEAFQRGLISAQGLARVAEATVADLGRVPFPDEAMRAARIAEVQFDLKRANALLPSGLRVDAK